MKKHILIASLVAMAAVSSFGQGQVAIKTSLTKNPVYYSLDNSTGTTVDSSGTVPAPGGAQTIQFEALVAPSGTPVLTAGQLAPGGASLPGTWTAIAVGPLTWSATGNGVQTPAVNITVPTSVAPAGGSIEMEIVAFTGSFASPNYWGYSGDSANFTASGGAITTSGQLSWAQSISNPFSTPPGTPVAVVPGTTGFGSIVLAPVSVPEPTTIALGGLGAAALLLFRRRK